jgi:hypothetical protein
MKRYDGMMPESSASEANIPDHDDKPPSRNEHPETVSPDFIQCV